MGRRRHWNWFSGIAVVLGVAACSSNDKATAAGGANACTLVEGDSGSVLQCGAGNNLSLAGLLANATREQPGAHCQNGGVRLQIGRDDNGNGTLEASEVDTTQFACGGESPDGGGAGSLIKLTDEAPGAHCSNGGQKVESGLDTNGDGQLQAGEVSASAYVCDGMTGASGDAGVSGTSSLASITAEPSGANCPAGGQKVEFGLDDDRDGVLDATEVDSTQYVCNGIEGPQGPTGIEGLSSLINVTAEPPGANCQWGGQKIQWGLDDNRDGILEGPFVPVTPMLDGGDATVDASQPPPPPPVDAAVGDAAVSDASVSVDAGPVDTGEIDGTSYVCNGAPGLNSLVSVTDEPAWYWYNGPHWGWCYPQNGQKIQSGMDDNRDGILDQAEVDSTSYVCDGATVSNQCYKYYDWWWYSWHLVGTSGSCPT